MIRSLLSAAALAATFALVGCADAEPAAFTPVAGQHYRMVNPPVRTDVKAGQVEVIEFFSLGCPHCADFEPYVQSWLQRKPAQVTFKRVPAVFNPMFRLLARVHFALEDVGMADKLEPELFRAIHSTRDPDILRPLGEWQNRASRGQEAAAAEAEKLVYEAVATWAGKRGADVKKFKLALNSPSMTMRLAQADGTFRRYGAMGVPAIAVDGRYFTTVGRPFAIREFSELIGTLDHLVGISSKTSR